MKTPLKLIRLLGFPIALAASTTFAVDTNPSIEGLQTPPETVTLTPWLNEILKLAEAKIDDSVMFSYVESIPGTFNLASDQIIYLRNAGVSNEVISEMIQHDLEVLSGVRTITASTVPSRTTVVSASSSSAVVESNVAAIRAARQNAVTVALAQPARPALPALFAAPPTSPGSATASTTESSDMVIHSESPDLVLPVIEQTEEAQQPSNPDQKHQPCNSLFPVRQPHAVALTAPIWVIRTEPRISNRQFIVSFP